MTRDVTYSQRSFWFQRKNILTHGKQYIKVRSERKNYYKRVIYSTGRSQSLAADSF